MHNKNAGIKFTKMFTAFFLNYSVSDGSGDTALNFWFPLFAQYFYNG